MEEEVERHWLHVGEVAGGHHSAGVRPRNSGGGGAVPWLKEGDESLGPRLGWLFGQRTNVVGLSGPTDWANVLPSLVFTPKSSTHRMHDPRSIVPHIRSKVHTDNQMS
jgi:hypothetical protein